MHQTKITNSYYQKGQALLIVILSMSVVLAVVLSVVSRSITNITITDYEEDSSRAFSAAEAGVEEALLTNTTVAFPGNLGSGEQYSVEFPSTDNLIDSYNFPIEVASGKVVTFWFVGHDNNGDLTCDSGECAKANRFEICWGIEGADYSAIDTPAVEIQVYYDFDEVAGSVGQAVSGGDFSDVAVKTIVFDPDLTRSTQNNFRFADSSCNDDDPIDDGVKKVKYQFSSNRIRFRQELDFDVFDPTSICITNAGCVMAIKIRMLYNSDEVHPMGILANVTGGTTLPSQGVRISSTGTSGESNRKVNVFRTFQVPPDVFNAAVFSYTDLVK